MAMDMRKSGLSSTADSGSYSDLNRLNQLKVGDKNSDGNMRKVAQEFESLFLGEMLKSMRSATEALGKDNPLNTPAAKQYQEMYDQQLAVSLSREGGGIGLADVLMRQMQKNKPVDAQAATLQGPAAPAKKVDVPTEIAAGTLDYTAAPGTVGLTYIHGISVDNRYANDLQKQRAGMNIYSLRGAGNAGIENAHFSFEYAWQDKDAGPEQAS